MFFYRRNFVSSNNIVTVLLLHKEGTVNKKKAILACMFSCAVAFLGATAFAATLDAPVKASQKTMMYKNAGKATLQKPTSRNSGSGSNAKFFAPQTHSSNASAQDTVNPSTSAPKYPNGVVPKGYDTDYTIMNNAKAKAKNMKGDAFIDILFLDSMFKAVKEEEPPYNTAYRTMKVAVIYSEDSKQVMETYDIQVHKQGSSLKDFVFVTPVNGNGLDKKYVQYTKQF